MAMSNLDCISEQLHLENASSEQVTPPAEAMTPEDEDREGIPNLDDDQRVEEEGDSRVEEDAVRMKVTKRAPLPTYHGFFTDVMLGTAAMKPGTSLQFKEICLSAMKAREQNEIPQQIVYWDLLLEEMKMIRRKMRDRRKMHAESASLAAEFAKCGCTERRRRKCGKPVWWAKFVPTYIISMDPEEAKKAAERLRGLHEGIPEITLTPPTPRTSEQVEMPVKRRIDGNMLSPNPENAQLMLRDR